MRDTKDKFGEPVTIKDGHLYDNKGKKILWVGNSFGADRIKTCINAFDGVSDPQAFVDAVRELVKIGFIYDKYYHTTAIDMERYEALNKLRKLLEDSNNG